MNAKRRKWKPTVRETATAVLLKILQSQAEMTADLFDTFFCNYHESYRRARGKVLGARSRVTFDENWADRYLAQQRFYKLLSKLKSEGLVQKQKEESGTRWLITKRGHERLEPVAPLLITSSTKIIVSYDIPQIYRRERDWLRRKLVFLEFEPLQKSVWIGTGTFSEVFMVELRERKILNNIHIMTMSKSGTLLPAQ